MQFVARLMSLKVGSGTGAIAAHSMFCFNVCKWFKYTEYGVLGCFSLEGWGEARLRAQVPIAVPCAYLWRQSDSQPKSLPQRCGRSCHWLVLAGQWPLCRRTSACSIQDPSGLVLKCSGKYVLGPSVSPPRSLHVASFFVCVPLWRPRQWLSVSKITCTGPRPDW